MKVTITRETKEKVRASIDITGVGTLASYGRYPREAKRRLWMRVGKLQKRLEMASFLTYQPPL